MIINLFTDVDLEAQRNEVTCQRLNNYEVVKLDSVSMLLTTSVLNEGLKGGPGAALSCDVIH